MRSRLSRETVPQLRAVREALGLTQPQLEELSGVPQPTICTLERTLVPNPKWDTAVRLSYALGEPPEVLLGLPLRFMRRPPRHHGKNGNGKNGKRGGRR